MPNQIEKKGIELLTAHLKAQNRKVEKSDNQTFDLKVDDQYAEVKTKAKPFKDFDFLAFTDNQYLQIKKGNFTVFLICNVNEPDNAEIWEFNSSLLKNLTPKKYTSYEYNKSVIGKILKDKHKK